MTEHVQSNGSSNLEIAQSNQDLILTKGKRKKRTWILIGVVGIIVVALVVTAIVLLTTRSDNENSPAVLDVPALSLEDLLDGKVNPTSFNATWASGEELLYKDQNGNLVLRSLRATSVRTLLNNNETLLNGAVDFEISADKRYLKVGHSFQKIYRHSYKAKYTIIDLDNNERNDLIVNGNTDFLLFVWAPVGNALAFVFENNIYFKPSVIHDTHYQITKDGNFVYNGIPDWVYEEEVFSSNKALWFSPDGSKIAYGRFDDRETPLMVLPIYGEPGSLFFQYPRAQVIKYPKVGTPNPVVTLHYVNVSNVNGIDENGVITLEAPSTLSTPEGSPILTAVTWATNYVVSAIWMNRIQNKASIVTYTITEDSPTIETISNLSEASGWLELFHAPLFSRDGSKLALITSHDQGNDLGSYRHVVIFSRESNSPRDPLTEGAFVVTDLLAWNNERNEIYYLANTADDPAVQHLYSVSVDTRETACLSCPIRSKNEGRNCLYNVAEFSKDGSHYALTCAGPDVPDISLYSIDKKVLDWSENEELQRLTRSKRLSKSERMTFDVEGGFKAHVNLKLPLDLDTSGKTKYPMLVNVYAGPDSFQVVEKFNVDWGTYLSANKSIIYATIDGRGSGLKGDKILFTSYKRLGTVEIEDQINVTRQIQQRLPYVDASRTAVWGWSYGGYASGMILADDNEGTFKCGISVAPVTDWTLYDSIYTERFMDLPKDNPQGYEKSNLLLKYSGLRDKNYFLIHGTFDDNVHYQQSMLWAKILEQNDILFRQLSYPDEDHGLGSVRPHLYHSLEEFLDECFIEKESN